ncbi:MAG: tetratricopeptide (TPR) repeat protein [Candidatus Krumholzibacteriia bacterium]|jgi:tetratricopeptide (TPR) repeat protein
MSFVRKVWLPGSIALVLVSALFFVGCRSAHTTSAILYIDEQNYDKAVKVIHEGFEYRDDEPDAFFYLGEAYSAIGELAIEDDEYDEAYKNYELSYEAYTRAASLDSTGFSERVTESMVYNYNTLFNDAARDWTESYFEQAEGRYRLAYAALPDSLAPIKNIARMKMQMSQDADYMDQRSELLNEALSLLDQVIAKKPEAYDLQVNKANVLVALGRNNEASAIFDKLLAEHGDDTSLLVDIANLAIEDQDYGRAADFYVRIVDLNEADLEDNDNDNMAMLTSAGTWYKMSNVGRYSDAIVVLDRAADLEPFATEKTQLLRVQTYLAYGKDLKLQAEAETDPALKADLKAQSDATLNRTLEIGVAMTNNFVANPQGFFYLSMAQMELGDFVASEASFKTYEQLSVDPTDSADDSFDDSFDDDWDDSLDPVEPVDDGTP